MLREIGKWKWPALQAGETVIFTVPVAVGRKDVLHVETLAVGIAFGLLHTLERVFAFFLGFEYRHRQRLGHIAHLHAEQIVGAARPLAAAAFGATGLDRRRGQDGFQCDLTAADIAFVSQHRINQVVASVRLVHAHGISPSSVCIIGP